MVSATRLQNCHFITTFEDGKNGEIKPKTNVVVNSTREWYGKNSTVSTFTATAYNEQGEKID